MPVVMIMFLDCKAIKGMAMPYEIVQFFSKERDNV